MARPYGFDADRVTIRLDEARVIKDAAKRILEGQSLRSVAMSLNDAGEATAQAGVWRTSQLKRILLNPRVAGYQEGAAGVLVPAPWPPIVERRSWKALVKVLEDRPTKRQSTRRTYLLTGGVATCSLCGQPLVARPTTKGKRAYVCSSEPPTSGCGKIRILAEPVEDFVAASMLARIAGEKAARRVNATIGKLRKEAATAQGELDEVDERLAAIARDYGDQTISHDEWQAARRQLAARQKELRKIAAPPAIESYDAQSPEDLAEWWEQSTVEERRDLLDVLVAEVQISPATLIGQKTVDTSRIHISWR